MHAVPVSKPCKFVLSREVGSTVIQHAGEAYPCPQFREAVVGGAIGAFVPPGGEENASHHGTFNGFVPPVDIGAFISPEAAINFVQHCTGRPDHKRLKLER